VLDTARTEADSAPTVAVFRAAVLIVGSMLDRSEDECQRHFEVSWTGVVRALKFLLPPMIEAKLGSIVTVASVNAYQAELGAVGYCSSKGAQVQLTRCVTKDYARQGIRAH
jgi:3-hydroxybutyrate dehydrogenase